MKLVVNPVWETAPFEKCFIWADGKREWPKYMGPPLRYLTEEDAKNDRPVVPFIWQEN